MLGFLKREENHNIFHLCPIQTDSTVSIDPRTQQSYKQLAYGEGKQT